MSTLHEELCYTSAVDLTKQIKAKELSPVELMDAFLDRIEAINPKLNAYVTVHPELSRELAKKAEDAVQKGEDLGSMHGLPISIKDLTHTAGIRSTSGSKVFENFIPDEDAPLVTRLKNAGAISLGKTNTPEFGWLATTDNDLFGPTSNPWNTEYTSSGSSGGAASACAAGLASFSMGSDGGGSIRHPASFCGLFGIKSTFGLIPRHPAVDGWPTLSHNGPLTRTVEDAALAMDVLTGYDPADMYSTPLPPQNFQKNLQRDLKGLRVAYTKDLGYAEVDPEVARNFVEGLKTFESLGCELVEATPDVSDARKIFQGVMFVEAVGSDLQFINEAGTSKMSEDLTQFILKRKDIYARDYMAALSKRNALYTRVHTFFQDFDLLLTPTMAIPPFKHPKTMADYPHQVDGKEVSSTGWHPYTFPFNLTGQPAATVPCGFSDAGLPIGLQIIAPKFHDLLVMQASAQYEQANPWNKKRPNI
jgi:aspartyl-tRNA(Asn)/glutamyl-tRNA(Gln) amidotransferase subunit A